MALPPDVQSAINEIRTIINSGSSFLNGTFMDEQAFFIGTSKLKKSLPDELKTWARAERDMKRSVNSLNQIDNLEMLAENGKAHVLGKVWVDKQACLQQLKNVEDSLAKDITEAQHWSATQSPAAVELQNARTEAERIIEDAKREAARIVEEAKHNRENPWSS